MTDNDLPGTQFAPRLSDEDVAASAARSGRLVYRVEIRTTPQRIWEAITRTEWTERYGYGGASSIEPRAGGRYRVTAPPGLRVVTDQGSDPAPTVIIDGTVTEWSPPLLLALSMRFLVDPATAAEPPTAIRYEIDDLHDGRCALTVVHDTTGAPRLAAVVSGEFQDRGAGGGHPYMLRDLKQLLETGRSLTETRAGHAD